MTPFHPLYFRCTNNGQEYLIGVPLIEMLNLFSNFGVMSWNKWG